jgi:hypothetical protein
MLLSRKNTSRLHRTTSLRAQQASDLDPPLEVKRHTVVADPINLRYFVDSIAFLMNRYVAVATENNQVLILIISVVANCTLSVFLDNKTSLVSTQRC